MYEGCDDANVTEAEKVALVAKIQWDQKIMEKESEKKMAQIEGRLSSAFVLRSLTVNRLNRSLSQDRSQNLETG